MVFVFLIFYNFYLLDNGKEAICNTPPPQNIPNAKFSFGIQEIIK